MIAVSDVVAWFKGSGANAQRGQPAAFAPYQATGPDAAGRGPIDAGRSQGGTPPPVRRTMPRQWFGSHAAAQRGEPAPMAAADHRPLENVEHRIPYGLPHYQFTRRYDRGSAAYAFDSGRTTSNPIGAGVVFLHALPVFSPLIGQVIPGQGIFWNSQTINPGQAGPELGPLYSPQILKQLLGPTLAQAVATQNAPSSLGT